MKDIKNFLIKGIAEEDLNCTNSRISYLIGALQSEVESNSKDKYTALELLELLELIKNN